MSGQAGQVLEILRSGKLRSAAEQGDLDDTGHQLILTGQEHCLTPKQIKSIGKFGSGKLRDTHFLDSIEHILQQESERVKRIGLARFTRYAHRHAPDEMTLQALLEHWADKSVLRRKWKLGPCRRCGRPSFVGGVNLRKLSPCVHCGNHLRMREVTEIAYALEPSVRHSLSQGLATVVLTGRFLRNLTTRGFFWLPGFKYEREGGKGDIDVLACCDGHLVFGECKTLASTPHDAASWNSTIEQFLHLVAAAIECGGEIVVLAALVDGFPEHVQRRVEAEVSGRIPVLLLNKRDLEKGRRPAHPENEWPSVNLQGLIPPKFPELEVERAAGPRQIKLGWALYTKGTADKS